MNRNEENLRLSKKLFLIDSLGALVSAFFLGVILVKFESTFGMPVAILYKLAVAACIFATYSGICYLQTPANWQLFLKAIALVNLAYSSVTIGLVFVHLEKLTLLGLAYFIGELIIVIGLAVFELKTASNK